jgi:uncharacterized protein
MFEFDPAKSAANLAKHGIDFNEAQALWRDDRRVTIATIPATEPRWTVTGRFGLKLWTAVITYRGENIRIISVRRARAIEEERYGSTIVVG